MIKWIRVLLFAILISSLQNANSQDHGLLLDGLDGKQHSLDEYIGKGKWVVVNVWATACPYCRRELFDLTSFHDRHHKSDAMVVGLTLDLESFDIPNKVNLTNFAASYLIDYPLLLVSGKLATKAIGIPVTTVPTTLFYNPAGQMVYKTNGGLTTDILEAVINGEKPSMSVKKPKKDNFLYNH